MKHSKFLEIKESGLNPRIARRTWEEQRTRDEIALILKKMRKRKQKGKKISRSLEKREEELRRKKLELEILSISRSLERGYYEPTLYDLKFLDSLSYSDLSKIAFYAVHWTRYISPKDISGENGEHSFYPKYVFLYETFKDSSLIDKKIKAELKEKAESEVWKMIFYEVKNGTFFHGWSPVILKQIFEYVPQKSIVSKLWGMGNVKKKVHEDPLWEYVDGLVEMDEDCESSDMPEKQKDVVNHGEDAEDVGDSYDKMCESLSFIRPNYKNESEI